MAANTSTDTLPKPALGFCKKCNSEHEKPIGNKCEKLKNVKEEKRDLSRETVKKTPRGKPADSHEKMMDMMLNTMNSVTEKLASMDERISGLTARIDTPAVKPSTRKSRSREQVKRRGRPDKEEALFSSPVAAHAVIQEGGTAYSQVFADTAVAIKPTPVRPKKHKATIDLGCTPLMQTATARVTSTVTSQTVCQPLAETVAQPQDPPTQIWTTPQDIVQQPPDSGPQTKQPVIQDCNQNILFGHVDQFGNPVRVQSPAEAIPEVRDTFVPVTEHPITVDAGPVSNINMLRSNPLIQQMVEERMALLEAKMKLELQGGMSRRRKSGRYNISTTWTRETLAVTLTACHICIILLIVTLLSMLIVIKVVLGVILRGSPRVLNLWSVWMMYLPTLYILITCIVKVLMVTCEIVQWLTLLVAHY